ncbi:MAG: hypothetical protein MHPDNHAH_00391 [Anaerolineales bacterium]|nr:hypothetical protein [Anaerolineales bacterium]
MKNAGNNIIKKILAVHARFATEKFDSPEFIYKAVFQELENLVTDDDLVCAEVLSDTRILAIRPELRKAYLKCVYDLEVRWAHKFINADLKNFTLEMYPKYEQYRIRAFFEYYLMPTIADLYTKRILFVGCGPLPLTSIVMKQVFHVNVDFLDKKKEATELAARLVGKLGLENGAHFIHKNILDFTEFESYDAIFVAGSVGLREVDKKKLINHFRKHLTSGQFLILRPPYQIEKLLISEFKVENLKGFKVTSAQIINDDDILYRIVAQKT